MIEPCDSGGECGPRARELDLRWEPDTLKSLGVVAFWAAHRVLRSKEDSEDIMQASLVCLLERVSRPDNVEAWVTTVSTNLARRVLKRRALEDRVNCVSQPELSDHDFVDRLVGRMLIDDILKELPQRQREALQLRFLVDLPQATVAEAMRLGRETVKTHVDRVKRKARPRIEELASDLRDL